MLVSMLEPHETVFNSCRLAAFTLKTSLLVLGGQDGSGRSLVLLFPLLLPSLPRVR